MAVILLKLERRDFLRSGHGSRGACMIARAMERQYGGKWRVDARGVRQRGGLRRWKPCPDAADIMTRFDRGASSRDILGRSGTTWVTLRGKQLTAGKAPRTLARRAAVPAAVTGTGAFLVFNGLAWMIFAVAGMAVIALGVLAAARLKDQPGQFPAGQPDQVPEPWPASGSGPGPEPVPEPVRSWPHASSYSPRGSG